MKTDSWIGSMVWGRIGGAVLVLVAFVLQGLGVDFGADDQQAAFGAVESVMAIVGTVMIAVSKAREKRRAASDQSGHAAISAICALAAGCLLALYLAGCATGPSRYAADNPDSYIIQAVEAAGFSPEGLRAQISGIVMAEIAMGTWDKAAAVAYIDSLSAHLASGVTYLDANALLKTYMQRYAAQQSTATHAVVLAYYLFAPQLQVPDMAEQITGADVKVLSDLLGSVRKDIAALTGV